MSLSSGWQRLGFGRFSREEEVRAMKVITREQMETFLRNLEIFGMHFNEEPIDEDDGRTLVWSGLSTDGSRCAVEAIGYMDVSMLEITIAG